MKIAITIIAGFVLFAIALVAPQWIPGAEARPWLPQALTKLIMLVEALVLMYASRRPLAEHGFRRGEGRARGLIAAGFFLGAATSAVVLLAGLTGVGAVMKGQTFLNVLLGVWLWSSITEEFFVRGWLQTAIARQGASPRAEVWLSGAFFGAMHLSLLSAGVEPGSVAIIVTATFLLGLVCAALRQRTSSLAAPIVAHIAFNVGGMFGAIIATIAKKILAG